MTFGEVELAALFQARRAGLCAAARSVLGLGGDPAAAVQDAFVKSVSSLRRGERPTDPVAWVFVVTIHTARDQRRRQQRRPAARSIDDEDAMTLTGSELPPDVAAQHGEAVAAATAAIARLDDLHKDVFLMRVSAGLTFEAAAAALGIPVGTAKTRMRTALQQLRQHLASFAPDGRTGWAGPEVLS